MAKLKEVEDQVAAAKAEPEKAKALEKERDAFRSTVPRVMVMSDARPRKTHVLQELLGEHPERWERAEGRFVAGAPGFPRRPSTRALA